MCFFMTGCFLSQKDARLEVEALLSEGKFQRAVEILETRLSRETDRAERARLHFLLADIFFKNQKQYKEALEHHRRVILLSQDKAERLRSQRAIVEIQLDHIGNSKEAIIELNKLLEMKPEASERQGVLLNLAKTQFATGNTDQAEADLKDFFGAGSSDRDLNFQGHVLKANLRMAQGQAQEALKILNELLVQDPDLAKKYNLIMSVSLILEEQGKFQEAIDFLQSNKDSAEDGTYIYLKIERLKQRIQNMPGSMGMKK